MAISTWDPIFEYVLLAWTLYADHSNNKTSNGGIVLAFLIFRKTTGMVTKFTGRMLQLHFSKQVWFYTNTHQILGILNISHGEETLFSIRQCPMQPIIEQLTWITMIHTMVSKFTWKSGTNFNQPYIPNNHWMNINGFLQSYRATILWPIQLNILKHSPMVVHQPGRVMNLNMWKWEKKRKANICTGSRIC